MRETAEAPNNSASPLTLIAKNLATSRSITLKFNNRLSVCMCQDVDDDAALRIGTLAQRALEQYANLHRLADIHDSRLRFARSLAKMIEAEIPGASDYQRFLSLLEELQALGVAIVEGPDARGFSVKQLVEEITSEMSLRQSARKPHQVTE